MPKKKQDKKENFSKFLLPCLLWKLPEGFIELGESVEEACRREINEKYYRNIFSLKHKGPYIRLMVLWE